ncbi:MAG: type II 3-dehydroquinate dehydratase [Gammaproteobacteria bacterium]|nr:type II 3-dehydroquinate dehydratase [Gammaproteobacteria bacterium]MDH3465339.1 type II 3-dehydroquinate dehydratase [Gammaproteobacteria bacterium]
MTAILVLHGPNLNLLGDREPQHYGHCTLAEIDGALTDLGAAAGYRVITHQSNAEHELVDTIQRCEADAVGFIVLNPAAFTHTSVALRDALAAVDLPFIEVHLSNVHRREPFRTKSYFSDIALGVISGFGAQSYELAMQAAIHYLDEQDSEAPRGHS